MTTDRRSSLLTVLCLTLTIALVGTPAVRANDDLLNGLGGGGLVAHGNDGVGGIERMRLPGTGTGNIGPQSPLGGGGFITPIAPTTPPSGGSTNTLTYGGWYDLGYGLPGASTTPLLEFVLYTQSQAALSLLVTDGLPSNDLYLVAGFERQPTPFQGGVLVPSADVLITGLTLDANGELVVPLIAIDLLPPLMLIYVQAWMPDKSNALGYSSTNAIALLVP